jgi:predicted methyltransferase
MEIHDEDLDIRECSKCRGERLVMESTGGRHMRSSSQVVCDKCGGRGVELTDLGARLFDFIHEVMRRRPKVSI